MLYLRKSLGILILVIIVGLTCFNSQQIYGENSKIINGQTVDDKEDDQCSQADLYEYVEKIKKDIKTKWQPVKGFSDRHAIVIFTVLQNGTIEDAKIAESSGSQEVDKSALAALKAASPLAPLPKGAPESIQIRYVFAWEVH